MTIASNKNTPRVAYTATADQTAFTIPFEFFAAADIKVYNGTTLLTYDANANAVNEYSLTGTASGGDDAYEFGAGGTVTIGASGIENGAIITIIRDITIERASDFSPSGTFDITALNTDLDKVYAKLADIDQQSDRSVKLLDTDSIAAAVTLPAKADRASKVMAFDADGVLVAQDNVNNVSIADESSDTTCFPTFVTAASGDLPLKTASGLSFNASTDVLTGTFSGNITGNVTGTASIATTVTITDNESTNEDNAIIFTSGGDVDGGNIGLESDGTCTYNPSTGKITATGFIGALTGNASGSSGSCTGLAATATALATGRNIGGVSFDGTGNIDLPGVNSAGNQNTSGTAAGLSATLAVGSGGTGATSLTANGILIGNGTSAVSAVDLSTKGKILVGDGSGNPSALTVGTNDYVLTADSGEGTGVKWAAVSAGTPTAITVADESSDTTCFPLFVTAATGDLAPKSGSNLAFNSSSGLLTATGFSGPLTGNVTGNASGSSGSCTGNAATATALATGRNIGGVSFDGTGNIDLPGVNSAGNQNTSGTAAGLSATLATGSGGTGLTGNVVGKQTMWIPAAAMYPNTTGGCAALAQVELSNGPELKVLDFDASSDEHAQFTVAFPKLWNEGTVTFQAFWTVTGTNTGTVAWGLSGVAFADNGDQNTAFGTNVVATAKAHSGTTQDLNVSAESGAVTIAGSPSVDELCYFQIMRDVSADDQSGDARLLGIKLFYTTDALTDT